MRSPSYSLREFSESVIRLDSTQILDAVLAEIHEITMECQKLGFGSLPKKGSKARAYVEDLKVIAPLFTNTTAPEFRPGFLKEAWPMLNKLSKNLVSLASLRGRAPES